MKIINNKINNFDVRITNEDPSFSTILVTEISENEISSAFFAIYKAKA